MKKTIYLIVILLTLGFLLPQSVFGIGQMTKPIVFKDVLRGQEVQEILVLFNSEGKEAVYKLEAEGEIKDWTTFYSISDIKNPIKEIKIPAKSQIKALAKFKAPNDAPNGTYAGEVAIFSLPEPVEGKKGVAVGVGLRVDRDVSIAVTDKEVNKFETTIIPLKYGVKSNEPLKIKVIYDNQGNTAIKPDIHLKITQLSAARMIHSAIYPYPENETAVKPLERKIFPALIEWPTAGQENGKYKAELKILLNGKTYQETSFRFTVGVDIEKLLAIISFLSGGNLMLRWSVIGGILLVLFGILTLLSKKLKRRQILKPNLIVKPTENYENGKAKNYQG